jgi:outer membrane lipase/esterase
MLVWLSGLAVLPAQAAFSSLYIFGDGVCTTTASIDPSVAYLYYGNRFCNGRIWVEVLAQRQGLTYDASKNLSYYGHYSADLVGEVNGFSATDATNSLFVVWVNDADFSWNMQYIYDVYGADLALWENAISSSLANHLTIIQTLYAKGARTLIMPNAVDIAEVPQYSGSGDPSFIRQMVVNFDTSFVTMLNQAKASLPGLTIYVPDFFTLLDTLLAYPANYGLVNPGIDAIEDPNLTDFSLNGPGAYYVFWDELDPTAKAHEIMADIAQHLVSPATFSNLNLLNGSNQLVVANVPLGLSGFVDGRTNLVSGSWTSVTNFNSTSATQSIFVPASGPPQFYRLRFPFAWSWP